ncbi:acid protease [Rostrohypoxylon terebratum]|nr:acid protease [Rostrohypoxylon terebratum]
MHQLAVLRSLTVLATFNLSLAQVFLGLQWSDEVAEYLTEVEVGTPGQSITVRVEFETFFTNYTLLPSTNSTSCVNTTGTYDGCRFGSFNQNLTSTFNMEMIYGRYLDSWTGILFADKLGFDGVPGLDYHMLLSYNPTPPPTYTTIFTGNTPAVANIEPSLPFFHLLGDLYTRYENILDLMVAQKYIPTPAFSIWLQDGNDAKGGILFGAIDTNLYEGDLVILDTYDQNSLEGQPAIPQQMLNIAEDEAPILAIAMTSLSVNSPTGTDDIWVQGPLLVRIKLGDDIWLSPYLAAQIRDITGAFVRHDETGDHEYTVIPCNMRNSPGYFTFGFGGSEAFKVNVTMANLVVQPPEKLRQLFSSFGEDMCRFGVSETKGYDVGFLSSHLLRSVYTVVDLYNNKVAMAPIKLDHSNNESNTVTFNGLGAPIPSATSVSGQPSLISKIAFIEQSPLSTFRAGEGFKLATTATTPLSVLSVLPSSTKTQLLAPIALPSSSQTTTPSSRLPLPSSSPSPSPSKGTPDQGGNNSSIKVNIGIIIVVATTILTILGLVIWRRWEKNRGLASKIPFHEQLRRIRGNPANVTRVHELDGTPQLAELPGEREPSELHGDGICAELPGDHHFPGKASRKKSIRLTFVNCSFISKGQV